MRPKPRDVRDHIISYKTTTGLRIGREGLCGCLKIDFREIFQGIQFSAFATISTLTGRCDLGIPKIRAPVSSNAFLTMMHGKG